MFVVRKRRFVISDDLVIKPASTANTHLLLHQRIVGSGRIDHAIDFEEIEVFVGWTEVSKYPLQSPLSSHRNHIVSLKISYICRRLSKV